MGFIAGLQTSLSGMKVAQSQLEVISRNIANADTAGYTAKTGNQKNWCWQVPASGLLLPERPERLMKAF